MSWRKLILIISLVVLTIAAVYGFWFYLISKPNVQSSQQTNNLTPADILVSTSTVKTDSGNIATSSLLYPPLVDALKRITKKPFGIYITPQNSPVQPENFKGYHTGVDFEILPGEENIDVPVKAVCSGTLAMKKSATGYGGVVVESCKLENKDVTIIYGHLKLASVNLKVGEKIKAGDKIGILGKGFSAETDGERKHLHLGIHVGAAINILGYVQSKPILNSWLDAPQFLK